MRRKCCGRTNRKLRHLTVPRPRLDRAGLWDSCSHVRIEVINTGTELTLGNTLNTHGAWFGRELFKLGLRIERQTTVPDGEAIREALSESVSRADAVIVTGGLGPTSDDLTREITAGVLGIELMTDEAAIRSLEAFFAARNKAMADSNRKQALVPVGADVLPNPNGTAPGVYVPPRLNGKGNAAVFLLPGPPRELHPMFREEVVPRLRALAGVEAAAGALELKFTGVGESDFNQAIDARLAMVPGLEYGYCAHIGEVDLRLIGDETAREAGRKIALDEFDKFLISDDGTSLPEAVLKLCRARGWKLATAESCTGGLIASRITDVAGSSDIFTHGFVTYANEAKRDVLGVPEELLKLHGAVSEPVARAMAEGALRVSGADVAVAVTGIAGPGGGSEDKPVGTVWLAWAVKGGHTIALRQIHLRNRKDFKLGVSQAALDGVRKLAL
ncbi:competence/damage-inducible protein A [Luteolibacter ambystomatis]|uniref:CinA-like protein n=1 Tax=Luteolibacter ambystomatis TaxID=2824561 RepID=A0A975G632_9BACT|nr:competence/damage-inducible protein A [Luteolibacter ambystomatis]